MTDIARSSAPTDRLPSVSLTGYTEPLQLPVTHLDTQVDTGTQVDRLTQVGWLANTRTCRSQTSHSGPITQPKLIVVWFSDTCREAMSAFNCKPYPDICRNALRFAERDPPLRSKIQMLVNF